MKFIFLAVWLAAATIYGQHLFEEDRTAILKTLEDQRIAWNNGNLEEYMAGYWKSDSLLFIGKSGVRRGWNETLESYRKGYPDKNAMGFLTFKVISLEALSNNSAFMIGRWEIQGKSKNSFGHFTLIWKKIGKKWLIIRDHSS